MSTQSENGKAADPVAPNAVVGSGGGSLKPSCFIIMPIADQSGYSSDHFSKVHEDIIKLAVEVAGYISIRADQVNASNMIHLDILSRILDVTMAVCDLSAVNPNVMFELGIRQAFDKPVVLLKDRGTRDVFDIGPIRRVDYDEALTYRGVMEARLALTKMLEATAAMKIGEGTNSIVNLLGLRAAAVRPSEQDPQTARFTLLESAFGEISEDLKYLRRMVSRYIDRPRNMSGTRNMDLDARQVNLMLSTGSSVSIRAKVYEAFKEEIEHLLSRSLQDAQEIFSSFNENKRHIIYEMLGDERKTYFKDLL